MFSLMQKYCHTRKISYHLDYFTFSQHFIAVNKYSTSSWMIIRQILQYWIHFLNRYYTMMHCSKFCERNRCFNHCQNLMSVWESMFTNNYELLACKLLIVFRIRFFYNCTLNKFKNFCCRIKMFCLVLISVYWDNY